jgi:hypothetical protein
MKREKRIQRSPEYREERHGRGQGEAYRGLIPVWTSERTLHPADWYAAEKIDRR